MSLPKCKDFTDYNKYPGEENPTTDAQMQEYMDNQNQLMKAASAMMWQPSSEYEVGDIVISPAMPANTEAVCMVAGMTDSVLEPNWTMENDIPDGGCFWRLRYVHYTSFLASEEDATAGTDTEKIMTPAAVKAAVGSMNAASATKLEVPRNINGIAFDGTKDITIVNTIAQGGTSANNAADARANLGLSTAITGASISGKVITLKFADGTTKTLTTQDTGDGCPYITKVYKNGISWYVKYSNGWVEQGSSVSILQANVFKMTTLLVPMKDGQYSAIATGRNSSTGYPYTVTVGNSQVNSSTQLGLLSSGDNTGAQYRVAGWAAE